MKRRRLSKDAWLKHTLAKIGEVGVRGIEIESMAKELNVTKGSFYWHFKDKDSLISEALSYWYESTTRSIGLSGQRNFKNPLDRLRYFFTLALSSRPDVPGGPIERALHEWARISELAAEITCCVDRERINLIAGAYVEMGRSDHEARRAATLALASIIGLNVLLRTRVERSQAEDVQAFSAIFLPENQDD
jgi:AcrR family transcriptional regulator